jgi:cation/acetate symporter
VLVKYDVYSAPVCADFAKLPDWMSYWANADKVTPLISIADIHGDGIATIVARF